MPTVAPQEVKNALRSSGRWLFAILLALVIVSFPIWLSFSASPVVSRSIVNATVKSIARIPEPDSGSLSTENYRYMLALDSDGTTTFANDHVSRPHPLGSAVLLERRIHADGTVTYKMGGSTR